VRKQIGLKLRAQDPCNLVYVMWRIEPGPELAVQVKRNRGLLTSAQCGNSGYRTIRPSRSARIPDVVQDSTHMLRVALDESDLSVWADDVLVWEGVLGDEVRDLRGPVGLRSDNARFTFALDVGGGDSVAARRCNEPIAEEE
jgi:hypothetical protein